MLLSRRDFLKTAALSGAGLLLGCSESLPALRVGANAWPGYAPLRLAAIADPAALRVFDYAETASIIEALRQGGLDAACLTLDEYAQAVSRGSDLLLAFQIDVSMGADALMVAPKAPDPRRGFPSPVALDSETVNQLLLIRACQSWSFSAATVRTVQMSPTEIIAAAKSGAISYACVYEPWRTRLEALGWTPAFTSMQIPGEIGDYLAVRSAFLSRSGSRKTLSRVAKGFFSKAREARANPRETSSLVASPYDALAGDEAAAAFKGIIHPSYEEAEADIRSGAAETKILSVARALSEAAVIDGMPAASARSTTAAFDKDFL